MKDFFKKHKIKKSFRVFIFFVAIIALSFGGYTACKLLFDGNNGSYWNGTVAASFHSGSGTQSNPYTITTPAEFAYLQNGCKNNVYIRLDNDIYLNEGDIEKEGDNYYLYVGNDKYNLNIDTGVATKGLSTRTLTPYIQSKTSTSCRIDGNNHKVYGLYIKDEETASFLHDFSGSLYDIYFQSSLIKGPNASLIRNTYNSTFNDIYFDGYLASSGESTNLYKLYDLIADSSLGSSSQINFNYSSYYAETNFGARAGVYQFTEDSSVYFYRGNVQNNNIIFGGFCWKILRTTNTGGTKIIYNGPSSNGTCPGNSPTIGATTYGGDYDAKYVGYTYDSSSNSNIKTMIDNWYASNMTSYTSYIEDTPYCNDRRTTSCNTTDFGECNGSFNMWYMPAKRASWFSMNPSPSLLCNTADMYTVSSSIGNGKLTYPVATISSDEAFLTGVTSIGRGKTAEMIDMYSGQWFLSIGNAIWTMSPGNVQSSGGNRPGIVVIEGLGAPQIVRTYNNYYTVRPVISLKNNMYVTGGNGTSSSPYTVEYSDVPISYEYAYSSLIGGSYNSSYNRIKFEGAIEAENEGVGFIGYSESDTINNFQINADINANVASIFAAYGLSNITNGYFNGNIIANTVNTFNTNTLKYQNVSVLGSASASTINKNCSATTCTKVYQSLSSGTNYASQNSIISTLNSSLPALYWRTQSGKLPEVLVSRDNTSPTLSIKITTKNASNQTVNNTYNSFPSNRSVIVTTAAPSIQITGIGDDTAFKKVQYYVGNGSPLTTAELDALNESSWTDYVSTVTTSTKGTYIYYFKVVDINNNVVYISSDYIVYDKITASYYNVDNNVTLSSGSLNNDKLLRVTYTTNGNSNATNFSGAEYKLNVQSIPVGTIISFQGSTNSYGERLVYAYKVTSETGSYINLSDFKLNGNSTSPNYDSSNLNIQSGLEVYYNFRDTVGGTFNTTLVLSDNTNSILTDQNPRTINITSQTDSISLTNNQSSTMALNSVVSRNIRYTASSSNQSGYYYLQFNILDSNDNIVDPSLMKGLSITYSGTEYYPTDSGTITIPVGTFKRTIDVTLKVKYLSSNLKPGSYFLGAKLYKHSASSSYSKFTVSTNYFQTNNISQLIEINSSNSSSIAPGSTLTFSVSDYTQDSNVGSVSFNTYIELYKKNFNTNTYSSMRLSSVSSTSFMASNDNEVMYPNAGAANINIQFTNALTPGSYKLDVRIKTGSATIKTESLYFVVVGG